MNYHKKKILAIAGNDALRITNNNSNVSNNTFIGDGSHEHHNDLIQIIPSRSTGHNTQFACASIHSVKIDNNKFEDKGKWQGIFCSDGIVMNIDITNNLFDMPNANHFISINGLMSGNISNNKTVDGSPSPVHLGNLRIGGNSKNRNVWVVSFYGNKYSYEPIDCENLYDERGKKVKHGSNDVFIENFDIDRFIERSEGISDAHDLQELALSLSGNNKKRQYYMTTLNEAAERLSISPYLILAVRKKEKSVNTFLFERHIFVRSLKNMGFKIQDLLDDSGDNWDLLDPDPYGKGGYGTHASQDVKFSRAREINDEAAHMACSWSPLQVLGFNYKSLGFATVYELVDAADDEYELFVRFMLANTKALRALRTTDFKAFARYYNGKHYDKNYPIDISIEYRRLIAQKNPKKGIRKSQTQIANVIEAAAKTTTVGGGGSFMLDFYGKVNESVASVERGLQKTEQVKTTLVNIKDKISDLGINVDSLKEVVSKPDYLEYGLLIALCILLIIPNVRILYTYMRDHGYIK